MYILDKEVLSKAIPSQSAMLDSYMNDLNNRIEKINSLQEGLRGAKAHSIKKTQLVIYQIEDKLKSAYEQNILDLTNHISCWIDTYEPMTNIIPANKRKIEKLTWEISDVISTKIESSLHGWYSKVLIPLVNNMAAEIIQSVEREMSNLNKQIDLTYRYLTGNEPPKKSNYISSIECVIGAVDEFFIDEGKVNYIDNNIGLCRVVENNISGNVLSRALVYANPATWILSIIPNGEKTIKKEVKSKVVNLFIKNLLEKKDSNVLVTHIISELSKVMIKLTTSYDTVIKGVEQLVIDIVKEMERGKANIEVRKKLLDSCETKIKSINSYIIDLYSNKVS